MPFLVILLLFGGGIVLCEFHFEARAEETVLGPFIPVMSSLPFCHSSICLKFFFFFFFSAASLIAAGSSLLIGKISWLDMSVVI